MRSGRGGTPSLTGNLGGRSLSNYTRYKARPTIYKGIRMRSRLEAAFAQYLDDRDLSWEYEPVAFAGHGMQYLPDFKVRGWQPFSDGIWRRKASEWDGDVDWYIEIKPQPDYPSAYDQRMHEMHTISVSERDAALEIVTSNDYFNFSTHWGCYGGWVCEEVCYPMEASYSRWRLGVDHFALDILDLSNDEDAGTAQALYCVINERPGISKTAAIQEAALLSPNFRGLATTRQTLDRLLEKGYVARIVGGGGGLCIPESEAPF